MRKTIGLVIPTRWESKELFQRFHFKRTHFGLYLTAINGHNVLASISGVGSKAAARAAKVLVASGAEELISFGFCGALEPQAHVGEVVTDRIITSDTPARTPAERDALRARANAVAVDMETRAVVEAGTRLGVPIRVLRVISDEYSDDLTPLFGKSGRFSSFALALRLFNPAVWPLAKKLRHQSLIAGQALAQNFESLFS